MEYKNEYSEVERNKIYEEFKRMKDVHYLDHAGATQYSERQINKIFSRLTRDLYCNPHTSKLTDDIIDQVRYKILSGCNATTEDYSVVFTSGATAALKLLAETFEFSSGGPGSFRYLRDNHTSVLGMREIVGTENISCIERDDLINGKFIEEISAKELNGNALCVFPAQCNFTGYKYPLEIIGRIQDTSSSNWYVCLDGASYAATSYLDLQNYRPDFVCLSFYKQFGYPTGLGALLVSKRAEDVLKKKYYGGGTVKIAFSDSSGWHRKRDALHERLEDGTVPYLSIISLLDGYETIERLVPAGNYAATMNRISEHCFNLSKYLYESLKRLRYSNGRKVVKLYHDTDFESSAHQGGIVNFNVLHKDGSYVGFAEVACMANLHNIYLRTGCFCNPGACQRKLELTNDDLLKQFQAGHVCGDENDLIDGYPTGSVRISVGYMTSKENIDSLISMIVECYVKGNSKILPKSVECEAQQDIEKLEPLLCYDENILSTSARRKMENSESITIKPYSPLKAITKCSNDIKLRQICVFPIKSCAPFRVNSQWPITRRGLKFDREWMIVQANGVAMTQKTDTKLCLIQPIINETANRLELNFPFVKPISIPLELDMDNNRVQSSLCQSKVCGDRIDGIDCGDNVADWLSDVLCTNGLRLIKQAVDDKRTSKKSMNKDDSQQAISLSNQAQFLLINVTSVDWLARKVDDWTTTYDEIMLQNVIDRFRGNLIIESPMPLEEMNWTSVQFGDVSLVVNGPCTRCQMICIDQSTGEKTTEPLRTIGRQFQGKMRFGIYLGQTECCHFSNTEREHIISCDNKINVEC